MEKSNNTEVGTPTESLTTQVKLGGGTPLPWIILGLVLAAGLALFFTGKLTLRPAADTPEGRTQALQEKARTNADFGRKVDSARYKIDWHEAQDKLRKAQTAIAAAVDSLPKVESQVQSILKGADGKRIASKPEWIQQFLALRDRPRPSISHIQEQRTAVESLLAICQKAITDDEIAIACDKLFIAKTNELQQSALHLQQGIDETLTGLHTLTQLAETSTPAVESLETVVAVEDNSRAEQRLVQLTQAQAAVREELERAKREQVLETDRRLQAAAAEQSKAEDALRVAEAEAKSEQAKQIVQSAQQMLVVEQARLKRLTQFERVVPEIRSLLSPMVSNGRMQLAKSGWVAGETGPLSYSALQATPAFRRISEDSWRNLGAMFCGPSCPNDRPRGSFPVSMTNHEAQLRKAVELFAEYGDLMVDRKLLRP